MKSGVNSVALGISRTVHGVGGWFGSISGILHTRMTLEKENTNLKSQIANLNVQLLTTNSVIKENADLKKVLGRSGEKMQTILATVISKPPS